MILRRLCAILGIAACPAIAGQGSAAQTVESLHQSLLAAAAQDKSCAQRLARMQGVVDARLATGRSAQLILGRHWRELDKESRASFVRLLTEQSALSYAERFVGEGIEGFEVTDSNMVSDSRQQVNALLRQTDKDVIALEYELWLEQGQWRVVNVLADGVSELAMRSAQYRAILIRDGADSLIDKMEKKLRDQKEQCEKAS